MSDLNDTERPETPRWLTVHAAAQFAFCPCAGMLTVETCSETEPEEPKANLDFSLPYSLSELEEELNRHLNRLWLYAGIAVAAVLGAIVAYQNGRELFLALAAGVLLLVAGPLSRRISAVSHLIRLRRFAEERQPQEPDWSAAQPQHVDWWELLAAGWMSAPSHQAYRDEEHCVSGGPWRTLSRGDVTIPVFKLQPHRGSDDPRRLQPQHVVRMVGYCHLIETCERRECPAGIVLFGDSYQGLTVANNAEAKSRLMQALSMAREHIAQSEINDRYRPDAAAAPLCAGCHWGLPIRYRPDESDVNADGEFVVIHGTVAPDQRLYHCPCGDRFVWRPPHELAIRLRLV